MTTSGPIIVRAPIAIVALRQTMDVPFNDTSSPMMILAELKCVINLHGAARELDRQKRG